MRSNRTGPLLKREIEKEESAEELHDAQERAMNFGTELNEGIRLFMAALSASKEGLFSRCSE